MEKVLDSSRYFVLRIVDDGGRAAFIGMGFNERNDAFDFTAAIQDHKRLVITTSKPRHVTLEFEGAKANFPVSLK